MGKSLFHALQFSIDIDNDKHKQTLMEPPKSRRPFGDGEGEGDGSRVVNQEGEQRHATSNIARHVWQGVSSQELASNLEPLIRQCVREGVQRALENFCCTSPRSLNALDSCRGTSLQLRFQTKLPCTLFTGSRIESEDTSAVKLVLFDADSNSIVSSGPLSSLKIEIVPLDGDFSVDEQEDWSQEDFEAKVINARDGKRPLVTGDLIVILKNGVGDLGDVFFTDNSSWRRSRKFRLGARAQNTSAGVRIREARSEAFMVKDHRGESYRKLHPPSLDDEVWRLEKIAKDGVFQKRLAAHKICTVKDLLQMYVTNRSSLRRLLGGSSNKTWETIIKHAKECVLDDKLYMYSCAAEGVGLLFNSILMVVGATFDGQNYLSLEKLAEFQMPVVEALKQQLYKNLEGMVPIDDPSVFGPSVLVSNVLGDPLGSASLGISVPHQDQLQMQLTSPPYAYGVDENIQLEIPSAHDPSMQFFSPALRNSFITKDFCGGPYGEGCSSGPNGPPGPGTLPGQLAARLAADIDFHFGASLCQGNQVYIAPNNQTVDIVSAHSDICFSRNGSPRGRWCKIRAAVKWVSVMRDVAAKRMSKLYPYLDFSA